MIGALHGQVISKDEEHITLLVGGVGYEVAVGSMLNTVSVGDTVMLHTHTHVREDALSLFGFLRREIRDVFRQLIAVNGVGPKLGLAILAVYEPVELELLVRTRDVARFKKIPGIGAKKAEKILLELESRLKISSQARAAHTTQLPAISTERDVRDALEALGFRLSEVDGVLMRLKQEHGDALAQRSSQELIASALRMLSLVKTHPQEGGHA